MRKLNMERAPYFYFDVPLPVNEDDEITVAAEDLDARIHRYATVSAGRDPTRGFLNRFDVLRRAIYCFSKKKVRVKVPIPNNDQGSLFVPRKPKRNLTRDLFDERPGLEIKQAVDQCLGEFQDVQPAIDEVRSILQSESLSTAAIADLDGVIRNPELRKFAIEGGTIDVNVDGETVHIESTALPIAIPMDKFSEIEVALHKGQGAFNGKVVAFHGGCAGLLKPGMKVGLGFLGNRDDNRATLMLARHFGLNVTLKVRQAVSTKRVKLMTLEVAEVLNKVQVLERTSLAMVSQ